MHLVPKHLITKEIQKLKALNESLPKQKEKEHETVQSILTELKTEKRKAK